MIVSQWSKTKEQRNKEKKQQLKIIKKYTNYLILVWEIEKFKHYYNVFYISQDNLYINVTEWTVMIKKGWFAGLQLKHNLGYKVCQCAWVWGEQFPQLLLKGQLKSFCFSIITSWLVKTTDVALVSQFSFSCSVEVARIIET